MLKKAINKNYIKGRCLESNSLRVFMKIDTSTNKSISTVVLTFLNQLEFMRQFICLFVSVFLALNLNPEMMNVSSLLNGSHQSRQ